MQTSDDSVADQLRNRFSSLIERLGLTLTDELFSPEAFGNSLAVLQAPSIRVKLICDRGQLTVEVARTPRLTDWTFLRYEDPFHPSRSSTVFPNMDAAVAALVEEIERQ